VQSPPVKSTFLVHEVVALSGFTKHMLDYLAREDIFAPSEGGGRGRARHYSYADVVLLRALNSICVGKGKIRHLRAALAKFRAEIGPMRPGQRLDKQLFVQGDELCFVSAAEGSRQLRTGQMTFSFVVDMSAVSQGVADGVVPVPGTLDFALTEEAAAKAESERQKVWLALRTKRAVA
jgi:hypothetical protein